MSAYELYTFSITTITLVTLYVLSSSLLSLQRKIAVELVEFFVLKDNQKLGPLSYEDLLCKLSLDFSIFFCFFSILL